MNCPFCDTPMEAGNLKVRGTLLGFFAIGWSYQHCWFVPEDGPEEMFVANQLSSRAKHPDCGAFREAHRCPGCSTVVAPGEEVGSGDSVLHN